jgi:hypothetical protein
VQVKVRTGRPGSLIVVVSALVLLVVPGALALLARDDDGGDERDPTVAAVCRVAQLARAGDPAGAHRVLINDAHGPLHALAEEAAESGDRAVAARLLEAKEAIESAPEGATANNADALVAATVAAARAAGRPAEGCT